MAVVSVVFVEFFAETWLTREDIHPKNKDVLVLEQQGCFWKGGVAAVIVTPLSWKALTNRASVAAAEQFLRVILETSRRRCVSH